MSNGIYWCKPRAEILAGVMKRQIPGQDEAVARVCSMIAQNLRKDTAGLQTFVLIGPPGTDKAAFAEGIAESLGRTYVPYGFQRIYGDDGVQIKNFFWMPPPYLYSAVPETLIPILENPFQVYFFDGWNKEDDFSQKGMREVIKRERFWINFRAENVGLRHCIFCLPADSETEAKSKIDPGHHYGWVYLK